MTTKVSARFTAWNQPHLNDVFRVKFLASANHCVAAMVNCSHILGAYNTLGKEETSGELKGIPRSAHGYRYSFSAEMDLARLLHRHSVVNFRHLPSIDLRHRAFDCGVVQESTFQDATVMLRKHGPGQETTFC